MPRKPSNDDPIILNVETDGGDGHATIVERSPETTFGPPHHTASRTVRANRRTAARSLIGVVLALAIVVGLFFALGAVRHRCHVVQRSSASKA